jgi:uncharacterized membrane protein YtjA (UPF0391 family)
MARKRRNSKFVPANVTDRVDHLHRFVADRDGLRRSGTFSGRLRFPAINGRSSKMLYYAVVFLVIALVAGLLGFGGIAGASAGIAQILFFVFLALLVLSLIAGLFRRAS